MELFKLFGTIVIDGLEKAENGLEKIAGKAKAVSTTFAPVTNAVGGAALALGGAGIAATKMASDYETAFAQVNTLLTGNEEEIQKYKESIIAASNETGKSSEEFAAAVYSAMSASVDQGKAVEFTTNAMKLAKGGFTDASTAVDILTTAINAYGLEADDADKIADRLVMTQNLGKTTVDELASSMGKVIPTAKSLGVDLDDLCGMYATMTSNGIATAETTTYMNSMLNELGKQGTSSAKAFAKGTEHIKEGGLSMKEAMEMGWELSDVLAILDEQAAESGTSINNLFGSAEAGKAAAVLWDNADKLNKNVDAMADSAGAAQEAFEKMDDTMASKMEKMQTRFQNMGIEIGEKLFPIVEKGMTWVEEHMPEIQENIEKIVPVISNIIQIVLEKGLPMLTTVLEYIGMAVDWFTNLDDSQKKLILTIVGVIAAISPVAGIISGIITVLGVAAGALSALLSPIGLVVAAIAAVIAIGVALYKNWDEIKAKCAAFASNIKTKFNEIKENVLGSFDKIKTGIADKIQNAKDKVKDAVDKIKGFFKFNVELPKIKLPHFGIQPSGWQIGDLLKGSIPKLGIDWYAKAMDEPMVMTKPTAFGVNGNGQLMAGGEAGSEVVSGTNTLMGMISQAVDNKNQDIVDAINRLLDFLQMYIPDLANMQLVMESGAVVGELAPAMDKQLGIIAKRKNRG